MDCAGPGLKVWGMGGRFGPFANSYVSNNNLRHQQNSALALVLRVSKNCVNFTWQFATQNPPVQKDCTESAVSEQRQQDVDRWHCMEARDVP